MREGDIMKSVECSVGSPCATVQVIAQQLKEHDERFDKMDDIIEKLRNRLPTWATMLFTAGGTVIGILATLAIKE
jgi:hypothetical protein